MSFILPAPCVRVSRSFKRQKSLMSHDSVTTLNAPYQREKDSAVVGRRDEARDREKEKGKNREENPDERTRPANAASLLEAAERKTLDRRSMRVYARTCSAVRTRVRSSFVRAVTASRVPRRGGGGEVRDLKKGERARENESGD